VGARRAAGAGGGRRHRDGDVEDLRGDVPDTKARTRDGGRLHMRSWKDRPVNDDHPAALSPDDDGLHPYTDDWWETETAWFSFNVPERRLGGWLYNQVLPVQGICNGGAWVWDDSAAGALYEVNHQGLPLPQDVDLRDVRLPNGNSWRVVEPLMRYELEYSDPGALEVALTFEGVMPPHSHPLGVGPFWKGRHLDQPGRVHGQITLHGEEVVVDCFSGRDRSWGPRPRGPDPRRREPTAPRRGAARLDRGIGYALATASASESFVAYTLPCEDGSDSVSAGYLLHGGTYAPLVRGWRRAQFDPTRRWITGLHVEAVDELGRELVADGSLVARHGERGPNGTGLFRWRWNGCTAWGEDQSYCSDKVWTAVGAPPAA